MKFGLKLANIGRLPLTDGVGRLALAAEELGFDTAWVSDHVVVPKKYAVDEDHKHGGTALPTKHHGEAFVSLSYVAGLTTRIELGTAAIVLPLRNPVLAAKMAATLDALSGGRVVIGAGAGWLEAEFETLRAPAFSKRGKVADEWIRIFRKCWDEADPEFDGDNYHFGPLHFSPRPVRRIPILVGGNSLPALRRAGRLGDGWHGSRVAMKDVSDAIRVVKEAARDAGRDPSTLRFGLGIEIDIVDKDARRTTSGLYSPDHALVGTSPQIIQEIEAIEAMGIQHLELRFRPLRDEANTSVAPTLEMIQRFAAEIMPSFRTTAMSAP